MKRGLTSLTREKRRGRKHEEKEHNERGRADMKSEEERRFKTSKRHAEVKVRTRRGGVKEHLCNYQEHTKSGLVGGPDFWIASVR